MATLTVISKVVPVLKVGGKWVRNPMVITDKYIEDEEIVYGEFKTGDEGKEARAFVETNLKEFDLGVEAAAGGVRLSGS